MKKKRKNSISTNLQILVVIGILVVINLFGFKLHTRFDFTEEQRFKLSSATKNIVKETDDPLLINLYLSDKLPSQLYGVVQYTNDLLEEYKSVSSNIVVKKLDPADNDEILQEALSKGIPQIEMQILDNDEYRVQKGFMGIALEYGGKSEVIPVLSEVQNLEYELTTLIYKLLNEDKPVVGFLTGHGEHEITQPPQGMPATGDYMSVAQSLQSIYTVLPINAADEGALDGVNTLVIAGPKEQIPEDEIFAIDQFILRGGSVIFLMDHVQVDLNLTPTTINTGLEALIQNYGVTLEDSLVLDRSNNVVPFNSGVMQFLLPYPYWPQLTSKNFNQEHPVLSAQQSIAFPWVSPLTIDEKEGVTTTILATTSKASKKVYAPYNLNPQQQYPSLNESSIPLIAESKGSFATIFTDRENALLESQEESHIIIIPDSDFISDSSLQALSGFAPNLYFFLNLVDYLTLNESLSTINSKALISRPIPEIEQGHKSTIKYVNTIAVPLIVILIGVYIFYKRKKTI